MRKKNLQVVFAPIVDIVLILVHFQKIRRPKKEVLKDVGKDVLEHYSKKSFSKSIINSFIIFIILIILFSLITKGCRGEKSKYLTETSWADLANYMFAVETDDYDGDICESGEYRFYQTGTEMSPEETLIVWDIYISKNRYHNPSELKEYELKATVGGTSKEESTLSLHKGDYVYVNYIEVYGEPREYSI